MDDIVLRPDSARNLQKILNICTKQLKTKELKINKSKRQVIAVGLEGKTIE